VGSAQGSPAQTEQAPPPLPRPSDFSAESAPEPAASGAESAAFAPFFTIRTRLAFGPATSTELMREPAPGSLSFGPDGFAIVSHGGRQWEKIRYRDLSSVRAQDEYVSLTVRDVESRLTLYHPWWPAWLRGPRRTRAAIAAELLARVRGGLTPYEISLFRRRLS
jgi:hypothetical protein